MKPIYYMIKKEAEFLPKQGKEVTWAEIKGLMTGNFTKQIQ